MTSVFLDQGFAQGILLLAIVFGTLSLHSFYQEFSNKKGSQQVTTFSSRYL